eukprot:868009-Rhodomonas_salina.2
MSKQKRTPSPFAPPGVTHCDRDRDSSHAKGQECTVTRPFAAPKRHIRSPAAGVGLKLSVVLVVLRLRGALCCQPEGLSYPCFRHSHAALQPRLASVP